jgi:hypothetical protein
MDIQLNELSKGDKVNDNPNKYNLMSKKKGGNPDVPDHPTRAENSTEDVVSSSKEKKI